jgi:ribosomal protein L34E
MAMRKLHHQIKKPNCIIDHNPAFKKQKETCEISGKKLWGLPQGRPMLYNKLIISE